LFTFCNCVTFKILIVELTAVNMSKRSDIWNNFESVVDGKARCKHCRIDIGCKGGSTSSLWKHLESKHTHALTPKLQSTSGESSTKGQGPQGSSSYTVSGIFAKASITSARAEKITNLIARMIAQDTLPISFVEGNGFRELMAYIEPGYDVPCAKTVKKRLEGLHTASKVKVREMLQQTPSVSLTTDCWTSSATESYMALTAHYINPQSFSMASWVLTTQQFEGRHTGVHIRDKLLEIMRDWGVEDKTTIMVHDNASNMNLASELSDKWNPLGCSAHHLNLAVSHSLQKSGFTTVIESSTRLVSHFRHSAVATNSLSKHQDNMKIKRKKLIVYCKTRWNSAYDMLQRLVENRWAISAVLSDPAITKPNKAKALELTNDDWHVINSMCPVLESIKLTTVMLSADENVSISIVLPAVAALLNSTAVDDEEPNTVRSFKEELQQQLATRFKLDVSSRDDVTVLHKAAFLDPRFAHLSFVTISTKARVIDVFRKELADLRPALNDTGEERDTAADCKQNKFFFTFGNIFISKCITAERMVLCEK
jgi:hypothetical protein